MTILTYPEDGVLLWMLGNVRDVCSSDQPDDFTCPQGRVNYNSAIFWGGTYDAIKSSTISVWILPFQSSFKPLLLIFPPAIGPGRLYNIGRMYSGTLHLFWIGAALPILTFFLRKKWPKSKILNAIHWPIFFGGTGNLPPAVRPSVPARKQAFQLKQSRAI